VMEVVVIGDDAQPSRPGGLWGVSGPQSGSDARPRLCRGALACERLRSRAAPQGRWQYRPDACALPVVFLFLALARAPSSDDDV
jgi:hypothetical protein